MRALSLTVGLAFLASGASAGGAEFPRPFPEIIGKTPLILECQLERWGKQAEDTLDTLKVHLDGGRAPMWYETSDSRNGKLLERNIPSWGMHSNPPPIEVESRYPDLTLRARVEENPLAHTYTTLQLKLGHVRSYGDSRGAFYLREFKKVIMHQPWGREPEKEGEIRLTPGLYGTYREGAACRFWMEVGSYPAEDNGLRESGR